MYTHKLVNGKRVELTVAEISELEARDAVFIQKKQEHQENVYQEKRQAEYPALYDIVMALVSAVKKDDLSLLDAQLAKIQEVDLKYPNTKE